MTDQEQIELDIFTNARNSVINGYKHGVERAIPGVEALSGADEFLDHIDSLEAKIEEAVQELDEMVKVLQGSSRSPEEIRAWTKGLVSGLQHRIFLKVEPLIATHWQVRQQTSPR